MAVQWELENHELRIEPSDGVVAWNFKNVGNEAAESGSDGASVTIWKLPDGVPWTRTVSLPGSDDVQPNNGVPLSASLTWDGQEPGDYGVRIDFNDNQAMADMSFHINQFGAVERFHNF